MALLRRAVFGAMLVGLISVAFLSSSAMATVSATSVTASVSPDASAVTEPGSVNVQFCATNSTSPGSETPQSDHLTLQGREFRSTQLDAFTARGVETPGNSLCQTKTYTYDCSATPGTYKFYATGINNAGQHNQARANVVVTRTASCGTSLTLTSTCTPFDDFVYYSYSFGPGTPGLSSLSYTYASSDTFQGSIGSSWAYATSDTGGSPLSYVQTGVLSESSSGNYTFEMRIEIGHTPGTLTVSDGTNSVSAAVPDGQTVNTYCPEHNS
jgi:hypothetical protein